MKSIKLASPLVLAALACAVGTSVAQTPDATAAAPSASPQAERGTRLQGTAFISRNRKVTGASVLIRRKGDASHLYVTSSDHGGLFQIDALPDGQYRIEVQREGMAREIKDDIVLRFPFRAVVDLPMETATAERPDVVVPEKMASGESEVDVNGRALGRDGKPLADVTVRFARWDGLSDPLQRRTAEDGTFQIPALLPGHWRFEAEGVGFLPIRIGLALEAATELAVVLVEQPADYNPSPLELMPPEEPLAPPGLPRVLVVE